MTSGNDPDEHPKSTTDRPFYTTDAFTDHAIGFLRQHSKEKKDDPFFLYLAYTAPHWPLQGPRGGHREVPRQIPSRLGQTS
jgi:arylsulfatase A-like enzyme